MASIDDKFSILKPFCLGYVSNDKDSEDKTQQNNWYINVYPMEILPNRDGDIMQGEDIEYKNITLGGQDETCKIYKSNCLLGVRWLGLGQSGRITPPSVRQGELVMVYKLGNNIKKLYWESLATEFIKRKNDKMCFGVSDVPKLTNDNDHYNKSYYFLMDTFNKLVHLHTAQGDEEKARYDAVMDTHEGTFSLHDERGDTQFVEGTKVGNFLHLDSVKDTFNIYCNKTITITTRDRDHALEEFQKQGHEDGKINIFSGHKQRIITGTIKPGEHTQHITHVKTELIGKEPNKIKADQLEAQKAGSPGEEYKQVTWKRETYIGGQVPGEDTLWVGRQWDVTVGEEAGGGGNTSIHTKGTTVIDSTLNMDITSGQTITIKGGGGSACVHINPGGN